MPTLVLATGFEVGTAVGTVDTTANVQKAPAGVRYSDGPIVGSPAIVTTTPHGGTYCLELSSSASTENIVWDTNTLGTSKTVLVSSLAIRFPTSLPGATLRLAKPESAALGAEIRFNPTGNVLEAQVGTGTIRTGPTVVADQWYVLDFKYDVSAATHALDWQVDASAQTQATASSSASTIAFLTLGWNASATATVRYDDIVASVTSGDYPLGEHHVELLTVDPAGTLTVNTSTSNFDTFSGATPTHTAWNATTARDNTDEVPPNLGSGQDGFSAIATATTDFVNVPMTTYTLQSGEVISGARAAFPVHADSGTAATIGFRYITTGSEVTLSAAADRNQDNTGVPAWVCEMLTLADIDTQTELDALVMRVGYSGDANPKIGVHAVYVEAAILSSTSASSITLTDSGTAADTLSVTAAVTLTDTGAGTDTLAVAVPKTLTDTGSAADTLTVTAAVPLADSGTGTDAISLPAGPATFTAQLGVPDAQPSRIQAGTAPAGTGATPITLTDSGAASDLLTVTAAVPVADAGSASDTLTVAASVPLLEVGASADTLQVTQPRTLTDTGSTADTLTVTATVPVADAGSTSDTLAVTATLTLPDSGTATDSISAAVPITLTDSGTATDTLTVTAAAPLSDTGASADTLSITATVSLTDTGSAADQLTIPKLLTDTATATDTLTVTAAVTLTDTGTATDDSSVTAAVTLTQIGAGTDSISAAVPISLTDTGVAADTLTVVAAVPLADIGSGADTLAVAQTRTLGDSGTATDQLLVDQARTPADTGTCADSLRVTVATSLADLATAADTLAATVLLTLLEAGSGADTLDVLDIPLYVPGRGASTAHASSTGGIRIERQAIGASTLAATSTGGVLVE